MEATSRRQRAIGRLQELGLSEYEAKSFVALARRDSGTAKEIAQTSDVPRTRVYDAVDVFEPKGLVEVQHSNPRQFRAVTVEEGDETDVTNEVWALSDRETIANRTRRLVGDADSAAVLFLGHERAPVGGRGGGGPNSLCPRNGSLDER